VEENLRGHRVAELSMTQAWSSHGTWLQMGDVPGEGEY
jgi:hypothetical protein